MGQGPISVATRAEAGDPAVGRGMRHAMAEMHFEFRCQPRYEAYQDGDGPPARIIKVFLGA